jgi:hypothetical protein
MTQVGFERTITASEQLKTVNALDRSATVTGDWPNTLTYLYITESVCCSWLLISIWNAFQKTKLIHT